MQKLCHFKPTALSSSILRFFHIVGFGIKDIKMSSDNVLNITTVEASQTLIKSSELKLQVCFIFWLLYTYI